MAQRRTLSWSIPLAAGATTAAALSVLALTAESGSRPQLGSLEAPLSIVLFQPPERQVAPGSVMEVGPLVDGYVHRPVAPPAPAYVETAWLYEEPFDKRAQEPPQAPGEDIARVTVYTFASPEVRPERAESFGFDAPQPDYASARRQREIERDRRMEDRREGMEPPGPGPRPYAD